MRHKDDRQPERSVTPVGKPATHTNVEELARNIDGLPEEHKARLMRVLISEVSTQSTFIGPLPPPADFERYNEILPGAAERIMAMAENEQRLRHAGQRTILANDRKRIYVAAWISSALIAVAGLATWFGATSIAVPLGLAGVIGSVVRLLLNWVSERRDQ